MSSAAAEALSVGLLAIVIGFASLRPRGLPEAVVAVPAALILIAVGAVGPSAAWDEITDLAPVVGFLCAVLVLAQLCGAEGLFRAAGALTARRSSRAGLAAAPRRLLTAVFALAAATTIVLSLDATVVLLTPVVFATAARLALPPRPHVYACTHLANSASLLLPVSNLTNLLAFSALDISFGKFALLMALPSVAIIAVEYVVFRRFFAPDLAETAAVPEFAGQPHIPRFPLVVLVLTLAGFVVTSGFGLEPIWAAAAGALVLGGYSLARKRITARELAASTSVPFLLFVLALGVVVRAVLDNGLGDVLSDVVPTGSGFVELLALAALAAALANLINNLPAALVLIPLAAAGGPAPALAVLLGVNIGPNLTHAGSLATLLWRRVLTAHGAAAPLSEFVRLGLRTVVPGIVVTVAALWVSVGIFGT
ncbi:SLC13 family permease [Aldersonia sp. NBC_00410]|uniref:SLC13 family permease n=1 Tax=Aldersonia sp. NBC_00410 TaxID=2975954 RepID=UPI0022586302|nr:SLC13 family permease [Aldersonia sp. NBC_00410]MCX5045630.1 SLC13 family permease [Aldersonia sp. NBC_00410]